LLGLVLTVGILTPAFGSSLVTLSSPDDLTNLTIGQQVTIDVTLQGLETNNFIFNLYTQVLFPSTQFQLVSGPTAITGSAGDSVFFADNQVANFQANSGALSGGGGVFGISPDDTANGVGAIGQNGLFYSFTLQAIAAGSDSIQFDLSNPTLNQFSGTETGFAFAPLPTGGPLNFTVNGNAVPEPASVFLLASGVSLCLVGRRLRRRRSPEA
jgi:hypothetical protein